MTWLTVTFENIFSLCLYYFFYFMRNKPWLLGRSVTLLINIPFKNLNHRHIITLIVECLIMLTHCICFVKSNGRFILLSPCSHVVVWCQHQQMIVVCLFLAILWYALLQYTAPDYQVWYFQTKSSRINNPIILNWVIAINKDKSYLLLELIFFILKVDLLHKCVTFCTE
jgi:hypothetical protein